MTAPRDTLLVIAHEATRTGAPRVLLSLLQAIKPTLDVDLRIRLESGGPLADDLLALDDGDGDRDRERATPPAAILVNSALAAETVLARELDGIPAAIYVHEDAGGLDALPARARAAIASRFDLVIGVSEQAEQDLRAIGVPAERTRMIPPVVLAPEPSSDAALAGARAALGAAPGDVIVLGCGEGGWRKGADLFVALAHALATTGPDQPNCAFGWVGLRPLPFARHLDHEVAALGLGDRVRWLGEVADARPFLEAADVLVMTSRNDPQPLVPVEAALLGTPTVGFAVGGLVDLDGAGAARTVPYPDVPGLAAAVREVLTDPALAARILDGATARWRGRQAPAVCSAQFRSVLDELLRPHAPLPFVAVPDVVDATPDAAQTQIGGTG
jgi:glycosyltransferase involved in cell wall biosynthesis